MHRYYTQLHASVRMTLDLSPFRHSQDTDYPHSSAKLSQSRLSTAANTNGPQPKVRTPPALRRDNLQEQPVVVQSLQPKEEPRNFQLSYQSIQEFLTEHRLLTWIIPGPTSVLETVTSTLRNLEFIDENNSITPGGATACAYAAVFLFAVVIRRGASRP